MFVKFAFSAAVKKSHPSLIGVVPPALRFNADKYANRERQKRRQQSKIKTAFQMIKQQQASFKYEGKYHIIPHFGHVEERFVNDLQQLERFGIKFDMQKYNLAKLFARTHDIVHNAGKEKPYFLNVKKIADLYGFDSSDENVLKDILGSLNFGFEEDNKITAELYRKYGLSDAEVEYRPMVKTFREKLKLSEEEMSAIVADAILYKSGFSHKDRRILAGLIQATEFKRSLIDGKPGIKFPRTQFELVAKLSDMGSFYGSVEEWLQLSVDFILETKPSIKSLRDFLKFELAFFELFVKPVIEEHNLPDVRISNGKIIKAIVPQVCIDGINEKIEFIKNALQELDELAANSITEVTDSTGNIISGISSKLSSAMKRMIEIVKPTIAEDAKAPAHDVAKTVKSEAQAITD